MSENLIFGYSVEERDGKLVITLDGQMAAPIMQDIAANSARVASGRAGVASLFPFSLLASNAVDLLNPAKTAEKQAEMSIEEIFGQGFNKDLSEFEDQLVRYRALLGSANGARQPAQDPTEDASGALAKKAAAKI